MELRQLAFFRTIAEEGSISAAARKLHLTQPPLSYQMKMLEEELGTPLFVRGPRRITLTEAGQVLYERAEGILHLSDLAVQETVRAGEEKTLHLGLAPSTVTMMAGVLKAVRREHPQLRFSIHDGSTFQLRELLTNRVIEIAILRTPIQVSDFETRVLKKETLCAVGERELLGGKSSIRLFELSRLPLLFSKRYRALCVQAFEEAGLSCRIVCECDDSRTALSLAQAGIGVALLPASMIPDEKRAVSVAIADAALSTDILACWRGGPVSLALSALLEALC